MKSKRQRSKRNHRDGTDKRSTDICYYAGKYKSAKMQWKVYRFIGKHRLNALRYMVHYTLNSVKKYTRG